VDDDMHIRKASLVYEIPHTTLIDWLTRKTRTRKRGREGTLTVEEKRLIVDWICKRQDLGWPLANLDMWLKVAKITQTRPMPFSNSSFYAQLPPLIEFGTMMKWVNK
jgi:hypothetical protein